MNVSIIILATIFFPIFFGAAILSVPEFRSRNHLLVAEGAGLVITAVLAGCTLGSAETELFLFRLGDKLDIYFHPDSLGRIFAAVVTIVWVFAGFYSFEYMKHEREEKRYFGFYLMAFGVVLALSFAGNIVTYYLFYELMTLFSVPLVLHSRTKEAVMGGLKYLFYSLCGAYMVLLGIYFLNKYADTLNFTAGGALNRELAAGNEKTLLIIVFFMILGFGVKAGMFPMHAWLPTAHPVAPAPASAILSGLIVKAGVLGIIRTVYFLFGESFIRGTWVQTAWLTLTLYTHTIAENRGCLYVMDPDTLDYKRTVKISDDYNVLGIGYSEEKNQYVIQTNVDGGYSFKILNEDFAVIEDLGEYADTSEGGNFQDLEVSGDF